MQAPGILTYAIGVFGPEDANEGRPAMQMFATAGGTGMPFVLAPGADLGTRLNEALAQSGARPVRPCQFMIPPAMGGAIDFGKVNVNLLARDRPGGGDHPVCPAGGGLRPGPRRVALRRGTGQRRGRADARGAVPGELRPVSGGDRSPSERRVRLRDQGHRLVRVVLSGTVG